jgi:hypothetical protein
VNPRHQVILKSGCLLPIKLKISDLAMSSRKDGKNIIRKDGNTVVSQLTIDGNFLICNWEKSKWHHAIVIPNVKGKNLGK